MKMTRTILLGGCALCAMAAEARADGPATPAAQIESLDLQKLAIEAAPKLPPGSGLVTITRGPAPDVPGLPASPRDKAAFGDTATTLKIFPSAGAPASASVSWSGYASVGVVYSGSKTK